LGKELQLPVQKIFLRQGRDVHLANLATAQERQQALNTQRLSVRGNLPADIILVDDVRTTGATLDALTQALTQVGVTRIRTFTFALSHTAKP
jgi:predicted amidophosphoribosyltransferase